MSNEREALPCPFCGSPRNTICEGSTFRWRCVACDECGARSGEVRVQTLGVGTKEEWEADARIKAIEEWNYRVIPPAQPSAEPVAEVVESGGTLSALASTSKYGGNQLPLGMKLYAHPADHIVDANKKVPSDKEAMPAPKIRGIAILSGAYQDDKTGEWEMPDAILIQFVRNCIDAYLAKEGK